MRNFDLNFTERRTFLFSDVCLTQCSPRESYSSNGSQHFCDSGGSVSCDTQLNRHTLFTTTNGTFASILLRLFVWSLCNLPMRFRFIELTFGRMPILTWRFGASTFQEVFTRQSIEFLRLVSASGIFFLTHFYLVFLQIVAQRAVRLSVSVSHDRYAHVGNCIGLPSNTGLFLSTGNNYLFLFQHHSIPCDS